MKTVKFTVVGILLAMFSLSNLQAQTADECIARYQELKAQFEAAAPGKEVDCVKEGTVIALDVEGPMPAFVCEGLKWDHWHLQARSVGANEGSCSIRLLGVDDVEGCGTEEFSLDLPANEAAKWRQFMRDECR